MTNAKSLKKIWMNGSADSYFFISGDKHRNTATITQRPSEETKLQPNPYAS
jgi:hypothetical protein